VDSFWDKLKKVQAGPNNLGAITFNSGMLTNPLGDPVRVGADYQPVSNGIIRVKATANRDGQGYLLQETLESGAEVAEVYLLPWKRNDVAIISRAEFEYKKRDIFFMTSMLSGCRFSVTPEVVMHVAHGLGDSADRDVAEERVSGPRHGLTRRVSISGDRALNDIPYGDPGRAQYRGYVFGMKQYVDTVNNIKRYSYTYKVLNTHPRPGVWEIIV
jgi:hypothetical protein